jgi:hypothetical protein
MSHYLISITTSFKFQPPCRQDEVAVEVRLYPLQGADQHPLSSDDPSSVILDIDFDPA